MKQDDVVEVVCRERCAQVGDPPCSRVCNEPHCDECIGIAKAVMEALSAQHSDEADIARARVKELEGALELAENRLRRRALDFDPTTPLAYETREWADEARQALKGDKRS